jgi:hypothetical protein
VHQGRRAQGERSALTPQLSFREAPQLGIEDGEELLGGLAFGAVGAGYQGG